MTQPNALSKGDSVSSRVEAFLQRDEYRGVCHTCLAAAVDASFEEVHTAIRILRRQPNISVELDRCRKCHDERVTIRLTTLRKIPRDTRHLLTA